MADTASFSIQETLLFRMEKQDILRNAFDRTLFRFPEDAYIPQEVGGLLNGCELVFITHIGELDLRDVAKKYTSSEHMAENALMCSENLRCLLDAHSRSSGFLTKSLSVVNLKQCTLMKMSSPMTLQAMGMVSTWNDHHSPQLLSRIVLINAPSVIHMIMRMFRPFASKATLEKIKYCGKKDKQEDCSGCPFVSKFSADKGVEQIPMSLGGHFRLE